MKSGQQDDRQAPVVDVALEELEQAQDRPRQHRERDVDRLVEVGLLPARTHLLEIVDDLGPGVERELVGRLPRRGDLTLRERQVALADLARQSAPGAGAVVRRRLRERHRRHQEELLVGADPADVADLLHRLLRQLLDRRALGLVADVAEHRRRVGRRAAEEPAALAVRILVREDLHHQVLGLGLRGLVLDRDVQLQAVARALGAVALLDPHGVGLGAEDDRVGRGAADLPAAVRRRDEGRSGEGGAHRRGRRRAGPHDVVAAARVALHHPILLFQKLRVLERAARARQNEAHRRREELDLLLRVVHDRRRRGGRSRTGGGRWRRAWCCRRRRRGRRRGHGSGRCRCRLRRRKDLLPENENAGADDDREDDPFFHFSYVRSGTGSIPPRQKG